MICDICGKDIDNNSEYCEFCGAITNKVETATQHFEFLRLKRRNNIRFMTGILLGIYLTLAIFFTFFTFITEGYTKYCFLIFTFICLTILLITLIIKYIKLNKILENKADKKKIKRIKKQQ